VPRRGVQNVTDEKGKDAWVGGQLCDQEDLNCDAAERGVNRWRSS